MTDFEFDNLIGSQRDFVFNVIHRKVKFDTALAEDLTQKALIKAYLYFKKYKIRTATYKTLLYRIAECMVLDYYKKNKVGNASINFSSMDQIDSLDEMLKVNDFSQEYIDNSFIYDIIKSSIEELKNKNYLLYKIFIEAIDNKEYSDIAKSENIPLNTVKTRVFRARKFLQKYLESKNISLDTLMEINN